MGFYWGNDFLIFVWEKLGCYFPSYSQSCEWYGTFSQVIPKVVNDKETFSQVIPIIMDSTSSFCPLHNCGQFKIRNFENDNPQRLKWIFINSLLVEHNMRMLIIVTHSSCFHSRHLTFELTDSKAIGLDTAFFAQAPQVEFLIFYSDIFNCSELIVSCWSVRHWRSIEQFIYDKLMINNDMGFINLMNASLRASSPSSLSFESELSNYERVRKFFSWNVLLTEC